jgi:hypothetical protein
LVESFYPTGNYTTVFTFHSRKKRLKSQRAPPPKRKTDLWPTASNWVKFRGPLFVALSTWRNFSGQLTWRHGGLIHSFLMFSVASQIWNLNCVCKIKCMRSFGAGQKSNFFMTSSPGRRPWIH